MKRILNKIYTIYCRLRGSRLGNKSSVNWHCDFHSFKGITLGENSTLYKNLNIYNKGGLFSMGSNSHVAPFGYFLIESQTVNIGNEVAIGPYCSFFCVSNTPNGESKLFIENYISGNINIGNNVFIGSHCVILPGTTIQDNTIIAANSVVKGHLDTGFIYGGSPAKKIKKID